VVVDVANLTHSGGTAPDSHRLPCYAHDWATKGSFHDTNRTE